MLTGQVPTAQATVHLAGVVRFAQAHFQDLRAMKAHLEKCTATSLYLMIYIYIFTHSYIHDIHTYIHTYMNKFIHT